MRSFFTAFIFILGVTVSLEAERVDYIAKFSTDPVLIINQTGGRSGGEKLYLIAQESGELIFRYDPNKPQEIIVPLDIDDLKLFYQYPKPFHVARELIADGQYEEAIVILRPMAYPLVQYIQIPADKFNGHIVIETLLSALVETDLIDETLALVRRLPITQLPPVFLEHSLRLANRMVAENRHNDALSILKKLPLSKNEQTYFPDVMKFADILREAGNVKEALSLYQRIFKVKGTEYTQMASLWSAYCFITLGRIESAKVFLSGMDDITIKSPVYSLKQLIDAKISLIDENYLAAIERVSQGVVYADFGDSWTPELLYTTAFCYENLNNIKTASEVYSEVELLYPNTSWGAKSRERLANLPPIPPAQEQAISETSENSESSNN